MRAKGRALVETERDGNWREGKMGKNKRERDTYKRWLNFNLKMTAFYACSGAIHD